MDIIAATETNRRGQSASRKTEALAVASSEARHPSSTRNIPGSTGRSQSVWSGPVRQTCVLSLPAAGRLARPPHRPPGRPACHTVGDTNALVDQKPTSSRLEQELVCWEHCSFLHFVRTIIKCRQSSHYTSSCCKDRSVSEDRTVQRKVVNA
jgi:hypothetical protein